MAIGYQFDQGVATLTFDRPEKKNAITGEMYEAIVRHLREAALDKSVRAVLITGAGSAFTAGNDLKDFADPKFARPDSPVLSFMQALATCEKPVVAAVNGPAVGAGCELAVAADFRLASEHARFGEVWIKLGCVPALGGMYLLPRLVGVTKATEMILTGEIIDAAEAYRVGLVNRVVAADRLMDAALELAGSLARGPARALAAAKASINRGLASDLWTELDATVTEQLQCFATRDFAEGVRALAERRPARFTGE